MPFVRRATLDRLRQRAGDAESRLLEARARTDAAVDCSYAAEQRERETLVRVESLLERVTEKLVEVTRVTLRITDAPITTVAAPPIAPYVKVDALPATVIQACAQYSYNNRAELSANVALARSLWAQNPRPSEAWIVDFIKAGAQPPRSEE